MGLKHLQLVPQNKGQITEQLIDKLRALLPYTAFRLHANAPVLEKHVFVDLNDFDRQDGYFSALKQINVYLGNSDYSLHSGKRTCSIRSLFDKALRLQDFLGARVAIEGQYRTARSGSFLINCWSEYEKLLNSECFFALDLSHLNIVRSLEGAQDDLVLAMVQSPRCIEIHVSSNDGTGDQHQAVCEPQWWDSIVRGCSEQAIVFSEGNRRAARKQMPAEISPR